MKRKTFLILALLMVSLFVFSGIAFANEADFEFDSDTGTITGYTGPGGDVMIPSQIGGVSVTSIGNGAFRSCINLTSVTIPDSVTSMGNSAFSGCTSLTSVTIPNSVTSIGNYAFCDCTSLTSVTIPNSVTSIGSSAFCDCSSLTSITIPNSVTSISDYAFYYCTSLTSVTIPDSVTSIGMCAFGACSSLTSITIPNSVTSIGNYAFYYCTSLTSITIPNSVTSISNNAFQSCTSLTSVTIPNSVTSIGDYAFESCSSLTSVTIPDSVTSIGYGAFCACSSLTSVTIPDSVTSIGYGAFCDCTSLTSVTIPNSVTSIGNYAFYCGSSLTSITIRNKETAIYDSANTISSTATIRGYDPSTAKKYAEKYDRTFESINVLVIGLNIAPNPITLIIGDTQQVKGILKRTDNSTEDVTNLTNWNINPGDKATISNTGLLQALAAGECTLEAIYNHWNGTEMVVYSDNAQVIITDPTQPVEPVEPEPSNPSVQPPSLINPGSSGGYSSSTTKTIEPKEPEKPVINPLELENVFVARLPESTTIIDAVAVIELTGESTIPIETPRLKQGQEYRAYYYNADKQKWIALASYANNNKVEFAGDIKEGYVAVFAVDQPIFEDLKPKTDIEVVINRLNGLVITEGYPGNGNIRTFAPERPITGVELATMQARVLGMVQPGQQRLYDILPVYQPVEDVVWYKPYIDSVKPLLPVTEGQTVTATEAVSSIKQLQKIIETKTEDGFKGKLSTPENEVITRADASRLILSLIEGLGW